MEGGHSIPVGAYDDTERSRTTWKTTQLPASWKFESHHHYHHHHHQLDLATRRTWISKWIAIVREEDIFVPSIWFHPHAVLQDTQTNRNSIEMI